MPQEAKRPILHPGDWVEVHSAPGNPLRGQMVELEDDGQFEADGRS